MKWLRQWITAHGFANTALGICGSPRWLSTKDVMNTLDSELVCGKRNLYVRLVICKSDVYNKTSLRRAPHETDLSKTDTFQCPRGGCLLKIASDISIEDGQFCSSQRLSV